MKYFILFALAATLASSAAVTSQNVNPFELFMQNPVEAQRLSGGIKGAVCKTCLDFFTELKKDIGDFGEVTKEKLTKAVEVSSILKNLKKVLL